MSPSERYTRTAIALHWIIAVAVIAQVTWGWVMLAIPKQPPGVRADAFNVHKSIGLTILALMIVRALWRWRHPAPRLPAMPAWQTAVARANHAVLYACLFLMPLAGYLGSVFSGYPVKYFGITLPAWGWKDEAIKSAMSTTHFAVSWVLLLAIGLHVVAAMKHWLWDRDGLAARMGLGSPRAGPASAGEAISPAATPPSR
jgi:cytochrome b561